MSERLTTGAAARLARVSEALIRLAARTGRLPSERVEGGMRIYTREAVKRFATERQDRSGR